MDLKECAQLICVLEKENETSTTEERTFNSEWVRQLKKSMSASVEKWYDNEKGRRRGQPSQRH